MPYTFLDLAVEVIKSQNKPMSVYDIWKKAVENNLHKKLSKYGKTPEQTLGARIYVSIKQGGDDNPFTQVSKRPALFFLKELITSSTPILEPEAEEKVSYKERDLHKILSSFVFSDSHFKSYTKTIYHESSTKKKKGKNEWLHPDIVGIRYPFDDYCEDIRHLMNAMAHNKCKIFSFELKRSIDFSTLREYFFQAVSNSSWANEGYLVALKYDQDPDFMDELRRLNSAFGIGFIQLNIEDYTQSEILLSAKENELDWNTIDRLCEENPDFKAFINTITSDLKVDTMRNSNDFDTVFSTDEEFQEYVKSKNIK
ncbi:HTH domain-containing protein [uncultured Ruminococcus sp.]|uniref:HTH domain-containing protein n=1 Tax=uncultured Ruminococcus sp. TaxID=165186 RepID=UPI0025CB8C6D|nr:HTH domain-containing protein [uncultured Ruminococcus sp.]